LKTNNLSALFSSATKKNVNIHTQSKCAAEDISKEKEKSFGEEKKIREAIRLMSI
jgi:hypothetical protein